MIQGNWVVVCLDVDTECHAGVEGILVVAGLEVDSECHAGVEGILVVVGLEVDSESHAVVEDAQLGPALEVAGKHCTVVECTLTVAGLEGAAECHVGTLSVAALDQQDACKELVCAGVVVVDAVRVVHLAETLECLK